jgi:hypothetical protein
MIHFLFLMLLPFLICMGALVFFKKNETIADFFIQLGIVAFFMAIGLGVSYWSRTDDVEILDGQVAGKQSVRVSCSHSYPCNCRQECTGTGESRSCTTVCDTCYEHPYDVDWDVYSSIGYTSTIARIDSQGLDMPPRWAAAYVGEPFAAEHHYTNYIKANPDSVLLGQKGDLKRFGALIPAYPQVYDYYKVNHVLNEGVPGVDVPTWNWLISQADRTLGPQKQLNLLVVLVPTDDRSYTYAFRDQWLGGKKNDAVILIGSVDGHRIEWADVISWTTNKGYIINLRDDITHIGTLDKRDDIVTAIVTESRTEFQRMHMKNYKWLTRNFQPSGTAMLILFILGTLASLGACAASITRHLGYWGNVDNDYY